MLDTRKDRPGFVLLLTALALTGLLASGCASHDTRRSGLLEPYRIDLPQGNYLTQEMVDKVKPGMTRDQVRFALGSPLLVDVFRPDHWNYVFRFLHANGQSELRRVVIEFKQERVAGTESDVLPKVEDPSDPALPGYRPSEAAASKS